MIPHLAHEQDAALSIYTAGERYVSSSPHAAIVRDLMRAPVLDGEDASATDAPLDPAGAAEAEADSPQPVAADRLVVDTERDPLYRDGVEHAHTLDGLSGGHKSCSTSSTPPAEPVRLAAPPDVSALTLGQAEGIPAVTHAGNGHGTSEPARRARLSRWQEQR